ncbi:MAG: hypothetical protein ACXVJ7_00615 [Acidimicrobiia bacterium]
MARLRASSGGPLLVLVASVALALGSFGAAVPAAASGSARALVIVDTGTTTYSRVVTFDGSISGIQALQLAGADPVVYTFTGQGGAVCKLFGVGRDAGPNCLGGADGNPDYWAYFRAPNGTSSFTYARGGAGSVQVHDGDVEGWRWGTGAAPAWSGLPPTTTTTSGASPPSAGGSAGSAPIAGTRPGSAAPGAAPADPDALAKWVLAVAAQSSTTTTTTVAPTGGDRAAEVRGARTDRSTRRVASGPGPQGSDGGGNGAGSLAIFAVVLVGLLGGGLFLRRARRRPVP